MFVLKKKLDLLFRKMLEIVLYGPVDYAKLTILINKGRRLIYRLLTIHHHMK